MKKLFTFIALMLCAFVSYAQQEEQEIVDITANFNYCWNGAETVTANEDGSLTFNSVAWGGLASWLGGADWSGYEKVVFEYAEPTTVNTQILVQLADESNISAWGNTGISELECEFGDNDMSAVNQIALQASAETTITIKRIYLVVKSGDEPEPVDPTQDKTMDLLSRFTGTWNESESIQTNEDGSKEYTSVEWGGMSAWLGGVDWSEWDALVMEFADATTVTTQIKIDSYEWSEPAGATSITAAFGENDMSNVMQVALQTEEPTTITVIKAYLVKYGIKVDAPSFVAENTLLRFSTSVGESSEEVTTNYTVTFGETGVQPTVIEQPVDHLLMVDLATEVTGGDAASVELMGWCYPTDREKTDDDMMRFPLTQNSDGTWIYDFTNMDVIPMLQSDSHHDWVLEFCVNGNDDNGNTFTLNNGGENYKILFSDNLASSVKKGDVNEDGKVDISDIVAVINQIAGTNKFPYADVNEDDKVDISDIVAIINIIAGAE